MKHFLVTCHQTNPDPEPQKSIGNVLESQFDFWAEEYDAGLYFISADKAAHEIIEIIRSELDLGLPDTLYVFEICKDWCHFGTTKVAREINARVGIS